MGAERRLQHELVTSRKNTGTWSMKLLKLSRSRKRVVVEILTGYNNVYK